MAFRIINGLKGSHDIPKAMGKSTFLTTAFLPRFVTFPMTFLVAFGLFLRIIFYFTRLLFLGQ